MKIINNQDILLVNELKSSINHNSSIYIATNYFSIASLFELLIDIENLVSIKILIDNSNIEKDIRFSYDEKELKSFHDLTQRFKADKVYQLLKDKVEIREGSVGGQKFILTNNEEITNYFMLVPHDLNLISLGIMSTENPIFLNSFEDSGNQYLNIFNSVWNNSKKDLKETVLKNISKAVQHYSPEDLYKFTLHNIFQNKTIDEISEQRLSRTGFKETEVWKMLFNFQKDAVLGAIDKIETFGGCIIADSVGLGKTFEALAVMKYYNLRNDRILVLCPKKLRENWLIYSLISDVRNILAKDRMNFDVLNHTDLSRERGTSGLINLETINWGNYDLIVIDESHNFRNNDSRKNTITRYQRLMRDIIKTGVKTKVLMLSATPVNTRMNDIKNQIAFITEQNDSALSDFGIPSIDQTLRKAQQKFNVWLKNNHNDNINRDSLVTTLNGDYFKILDLLTIARSYSVDFKSEKLIQECVKNINNRLVVHGGKLSYDKIKLDITEGGVTFNEPTTNYDVVKQEVSILPDIISYLQNETRLTRKSIVEILQGCDNLNYFKINPQKYIEGCIDIINEQMRLHIVDGIVYKRIGENDFYSQELFENEELSGYLKSNMIESSKSPFEYTIYDSGIEKDLSREFEKNNNVKVYTKLPNWFKIETPLGNYNPDWAVLFEIEGKEQLYFVVESKGTLGYDFLRPSEQGKIDCGKKHFEELANTTNSNIKLELVTNGSDFIDLALSKL